MNDRAAQLAARTENFRTTERQGVTDASTTTTIELANALDWLPQQQKADLLLTDPPFSTDIEDINAFAAAWLPKGLATLKPSGSALIFVGAYPHELHAYFNVRTPDQLLVWNYKNTLGRSPKRKFNLDWQAILFYQGANAADFNITRTAHTRTVQTVNAPDGRLGDRIHKWQKPTSLIAQYIELLTNPLDTILDPFAGSGTTLVAAALTNRHAHGCDTDPAAIDLTAKRGIQWRR